MKIKYGAKSKSTCAEGEFKQCKQWRTKLTVESTNTCAILGIIQEAQIVG